jgi:hypothetical protein
MQKATKKAVNNTAKKMSQNLSNIFANTPKGMAINVPENISGEKIKKAKKLSEITAEKLAINTAEKEKRRSLTYNLNALKGSAEKYANLLGTKYQTAVSIDELMATLKTPKVFLAYLSEKQKAQFEAKKLGFSYWLILGLVAKHFKANKGK